MHEQWSEEANVPGQHWVGFRIIDIAPSDSAVMRGVAQELPTRLD